MSTSSFHSRRMNRLFVKLCFEKLSPFPILRTRQPNIYFSIRNYSIIISNFATTVSPSLQRSLTRRSFVNLNARIIGKSYCCNTLNSKGRNGMEWYRARSLNAVSSMRANHRSGTPSRIPDENLLFGLGVRRTTCRAANFRGRLMAPLCKTWCNYTQLLELSFSSPHPSPPHLSRFRPCTLLSQKILCRRFYCRVPTYPFHGRSQDLV